MRLDKYNIYMATVRSPEFLKEWKILSEIQDRGEYDTWKTWMAKKWGENLLRPLPSYVDHYNSSFDYAFPNLYPAAVEKIDIEKAATIATTFPQVKLRAIKP